MAQTAFSTKSKKSGKTYFLHSREQALKGGRVVTLYYFASVAGEGACTLLPSGYEVAENGRSGLPMLRKKK